MRWPLVSRWSRRLVLSISAAAALLSGAVFAQEMDRPTARATWKAQWYNESATPEVIAKGKQGARDDGCAQREVGQACLSTTADALSAPPPSCSRVMQGSDARR